ncbi:MAG TPA: 16S rRNA (adenine(1518)-N(6)/adenine(1519)-N(6))-dimethyltransferase RsmA [Gammaproteobacteria bacterium]|nr:16S rRNA (adenine(1518)-N(6)/adenine(1519)-N(6))-dimethyltransferase RsmA [Gammaproteobacteria bacterium]
MSVTHRARKRYGQHFLHDPRVISRILDAIRPDPDDRLVEIGPGLGALTLPLLQRCRALDVVELDRDLIPTLARLCAGHGTLRVHRADALAFDFAALAGERRGPLRLVGNLPYNISTPLLFHLLDQAEAILDMHFMLQREVVDRMVAGPGSGTYGRLSVMLAWRCRVERLFRIGSGAFRPPPRVDSAFVRLLPLRAPPFAVTDPATFRAIVAQAFSQRRKTLRNALRRYLDEADIRAAGADPGLRPEQLSPAQFGALANRAAGRA